MMIKLAIAAGLLVLALLARKSRPAHDRIGHGLNAPAKTTRAPDTLTVATYNVQTGKNLKGQRDISRAAGLIRDADMVGVQEVYAPRLIELLGLQKQQSEALAKPGGFSWLFCPTRRRWLREHRGNLLLSKLPIDTWRLEMLPDQSGKSFRNMTIAEFEWQGEKITLINTHLHTRQGREEQLDLVLREFARHRRAILMGDFNSRADSALLASALRNVEITDAIAAANLDTNNQDRIDWILTKGFVVNRGRMIEKGVSDHPYYEVNLSIKPI